jgi:aminomethyltransferase
MMRKLPLHDLLAANGASFKERYGVDVPSVVSDLKKEYQIIRDAVGVTDFSFVQKFRVSGDTGVDLLDKLFAGNVAKIRFCRVLHTFLADDQGNLAADVYVANNDEDFIVLCESIVDDAGLKKLFEKSGVSVGGEGGLEDITESHVVISIDGYHAWKVVKELFGADVLGLPYLSVETYPYEGSHVLLFRAGKTCEFGYLLMAPKEIGGKLMEATLALAQKYEGGLCGVDIHNELRLEGRFFNIFAEGARVKDPLPLGLQWMVDFDKESFLGSDAILQRRSEGLKNKIIGVKADLPADGLKVDDPLFCEGRQVGSVQAVCFSQVLNAPVGLALFPLDMAYAGLRFNVQKPDGPQVQTISMPPIMPKSLSANLQEM